MAETTQGPRLTRPVKVSDSTGLNATQEEFANLRRQTEVTHHGSRANSYQWRQNSNGVRNTAFLVGQDLNDASSHVNKSRESLHTETRRSQQSADSSKLGDASALDRPSSTWSRPLSTKDDSTSSVSKRVTMNGSDPAGRTMYRKGNSVSVPSGITGIGPEFEERARAPAVAGSPIMSRQMPHRHRTAQDITHFDALRVPLRPSFAASTTQASGARTGGTLASTTPAYGAQTDDMWFTLPPRSTHEAHKSTSFMAPPCKPSVVAHPCINPCSLTAPARSTDVEKIMKGRYADIRVVRSVSSCVEMPTTVAPNLLDAGPHSTMAPQSSYAYATFNCGGDMLSGTYELPSAVDPYLTERNNHWNVVTSSCTPHYASSPCQCCGASQSSPQYVSHPTLGLAMATQAKSQHDIWHKRCDWPAKSHQRPVHTDKIEERIAYPDFCNNSSRCASSQSNTQGETTSNVLGVGMLTPHTSTTEKDSEEDSCADLARSESSAARITRDVTVFSPPTRDVGTSTSVDEPAAKTTQSPRRKKKKTPRGQTASSAMVPAKQPGAKNAAALKSQIRAGAKSAPAPKSRTLRGVKSAPAPKNQARQGVKSAPVQKSRTPPGVKGAPAPKSRTFPGLKSAPAPKNQARQGIKSAPVQKSRTPPGVKSAPAPKSRTPLGVKNVPVPKSRTPLGVKNAPVSKSRTPVTVKSAPAPKSRTQPELTGQKKSRPK